MAKVVKCFFPLTWLLLTFEWRNKYRSAAAVRGGERSEGERKMRRSHTLIKINWRLHHSLCQAHTRGADSFYLSIYFSLPIKKIYINTEAPFPRHNIRWKNGHESQNIRVFFFLSLFSHKTLEAILRKQLYKENGHARQHLFIDFIYVFISLPWTRRLKHLHPHTRLHQRKLSPWVVRQVIVYNYRPPSDMIWIFTHSANV